MATADDSLPDPLSLLRRSIASGNQPITATAPDPTTQEASTSSLAEAAYLIFKTQTPQDGAEYIPVPLTQTTRFISQAENKALDLRSVYFCWLNKDTGLRDYINAVAELNSDLRSAGKTDQVTNLVFAEKLDLVSWLAGDAGEEESEYIKSSDDNKTVRREANDAAATAQGGEDVEMRDADLTVTAARKREEERLKEIYAAERKMGDRNTILRGTGKIQDFSGIRKYSALFLSKARAPQTAPTPALTNNPALRPPSKPAQSGRRLEPIIMVSPSQSSLILMQNIKTFLEQGIWTKPEGPTDSHMLQVSRGMPSISPHNCRFILVDSPDQFKPDYWQKVVAVFTTGQTWQFKNYKWQNAAELFAHALGIYVGWKGEVVPDTVKGWGRGVLVAQIDKGTERWRDREVVEDIWSAIEARMKANGWSKNPKG